MSLDDVLEGLARRLGVAAFEPEPDGSYALSFDGSLHVRLLPHGRSDLYLIGRVGRLPDDPRDAEQRLREALGRSLALAREREETLALAPGGDELLLYRKLDLAALDTEPLADALADFLDQLELWTGAAAAQRPMPPPMTMIFP